VGSLHTTLSMCRDSDPVMFSGGIYWPSRVHSTGEPGGFLTCALGFRRVSLLEREPVSFPVRPFLSLSVSQMALLYPTTY
jgi:hypothetical protein